MHPVEEQAHELGSRVYVALRDGGLDAAPVLELASLLEEWGLSTATTRELLESSAARPSAADLARLGQGLLDDIDFRPGFAVDPQLWTTLEQALEVVERDVRVAGITGRLRLITDPLRGRHDAQVEYEGSYHGNGIPPEGGQRPAASVAVPRRGGPGDPHGAHLDGVARLPRARPWAARRRGGSRACLAVHQRWRACRRAGRRVVLSAPGRGRRPARRRAPGRV